MSLNKNIITRLFLVTIALVAIYMVYGLNMNNLAFSLPFRIKKMVSIIIVSILMSYSSIGFQTITHNRLLTPSVMGLDMLYILIQTLIVFVLKFTVSNQIFEFILSIILMVLMSLVLFKFFFQDSSRNVYFLILSGMVLGTLFSSLSNFIQLIMDPHEFDLVQSRIIASFSGVNETLLIISILISLGLFYFVIKDIDDLDVLNLGRDKSINLGVDYKETVKKHLILISISIGLVSALVGPLSFLSILIASLARQLTQGFSHKMMILIGTLISIICLIFGLWMVEQIFNHQTTISVLINFVGGLYFISLMLKERQV